MTRGIYVCKEPTRHPRGSVTTEGSCVEHKQKNLNSPINPNLRLKTVCIVQGGGEKIVEKITCDIVGAHCVRPHWCFCYFNGRGDPSPTGWVGYFLWKCSRFDSNSAIFYSSKLQFFDKGEKRYVLFDEFKQYNLREICLRQRDKKFFASFFSKKRKFLLF